MNIALLGFGVVGSGVYECAAAGKISMSAVS